MKIGKILKFVAVNIVVFAILLVALNWACGVYLRKVSKSNRSELPNYKGDHEHARAVFADYNRIQHRYEPFVGWKTLPYNGKTTHISQAGLRTHDLSPAASEDRQVVRFFGGSTMWGEGSDDQNTIPALFNDLNPDLKVFNHGQLAYNTRQELDELISVYSREERTDIAIFYDGVNDAAFLCPSVIEQLPAHRLVPMYREKLYVGTSEMIKDVLKKIFIEDILGVIQRAAYQGGNEEAAYDCTSNAAKADAIAEMMMKNWELAHEIVTKRNGTFIAVLQPAAFIGNARTDHLTLDEQLGKNFHEIYGRLKKKIAERNHPWIIDLSSSFDNDQYIFIDFCHVSPNGNAIIAREISNVVNGLEE